MHPFQIPNAMSERVIARNGRPHPFDRINIKRAALVVIDMQNYFVKQGFLGEVPVARRIVPNINRLADHMRRQGGHVVWIQNSTTDTRESWSTLHECLLTPERMQGRYDTMSEGHEGHELWPELDTKPGDSRLVKKRFSAFIQGSSGLDRLLKERGVDTILVAGTATNVCCDSTAKDAAMLNYKVVMLSDGTAAATDDEHSAALHAFYLYFGDVQTVDEAIRSTSPR